MENKNTQIELICYQYGITPQNIYTTQEWNSIAQELYEITNKIKVYDTKKKFLRDKIIKLSNNQTGTNLDYILERIVSVGPVDYMKMAQDYNINIDLYRKDPITRWTFKKIEQ